MDEATRDKYGDLEWAQPDWLLKVRAWIEQHVEIAGELEQVHLRPWSTVLRVPTAEGDVFFKAVWTDSIFEPALTALLARLRPGHIAEPVAVDPERGWMLSRDAGTRLRDLIHSAADLHHWETLLPAYAELQLELAAEPERLLELGVPDRRLSRIPDLLASLLDDTEALMLDLPDGLTSEELAQMRKQVPEVEAMCRELGETRIPETIQHDDLHDGNVFVKHGKYVFFDWGDACVSHPFHTLVTTMRGTAHRLGLDPGGEELLRMRDAYLEPFGLYAGLGTLREVFEVAYRVGTIGRTLSWYDYVRGSHPLYRPDVADTVPYGLQRYLEHGPIGTWRWH